MFSEVEWLVSYAIQICLSVLLVTSVNFSPRFTTRQEEGYPSDGGLAPLFALPCDCYFLPLKVSFAKPAENPGQLLFCLYVYWDCQVSCYGRVFAGVSGICHRSVISVQRDLSVKGVGTPCRQPCASLNPFKGNKKLNNLEREFCTTRHAAVMSGWWSCSHFVRERIFSLLLEVTEEQLQAYHSRKGALTFQ